MEISSTPYYSVHYVGLSCRVSSAQCNPQLLNLPLQALDVFHCCLHQLGLILRQFKNVAVYRDGIGRALLSYLRPTGPCMHTPFQCTSHPVQGSLQPVPLLFLRLGVLFALELRRAGRSHDHDRPYPVSLWSSQEWSVVIPFGRSSISLPSVDIDDRFLAPRLSIADRCCSLDMINDACCAAPSCPLLGLLVSADLNVLSASMSKLNREEMWSLSTPSSRCSGLLHAALHHQALITTEPCLLCLTLLIKGIKTQLPLHRALQCLLQSTYRQSYI